MDVTRAIQVDQMQFLVACLRTGLAIALQHQKLMIIQGQDFRYAIPGILQGVGEFMDRARLQIDIQNAIVEANQFVLAVMVAILDEGVLDDGYKTLAVRRYRQGFQAPVALTADQITIQFFPNIFRRVINMKLVGYG